MNNEHLPCDKNRVTVQSSRPRAGFPSTEPARGGLTQQGGSEQLQKRRISDRVFELWGWTLFILSAIFFIIASLRSGDWISLLGGLFFLLANIVFLIPILRKNK